MGGCFLSRRQCQDAAEIALEAKHRAPVFAGAGRDHDPADERPNVVVRLKPGPFVGQGLDQPVDPLAVFWTLLTKVETSCDRILIAGGANVEAEWEQGPTV